MNLFEVYDCHLKIILDFNIKYKNEIKYMYPRHDRCKVIVALVSLKKYTAPLTSASTYFVTNPYRAWETANLLAPAYASSLFFFTNHSSRSFSALIMVKISENFLTCFSKG